jgi:hypothetical protein
MGVLSFRAMRPGNTCDVQWSMCAPQAPSESADTIGQLTPVGVRSQRWVDTAVVQFQVTRSNLKRRHFQIDVDNRDYH